MLFPESFELVGVMEAVALESWTSRKSAVMAAPVALIVHWVPGVVEFKSIRVVVACPLSVRVVVMVWVVLAVTSRRLLAVVTERAAKVVDPAMVLVCEESLKITVLLVLVKVPLLVQFPPRVRVLFPPVPLAALRVPVMVMALVQVTL